MHLNRYKMTDPSDIYNIPWDLTQDGVATSLRISRAHASIELKKLREAGKVDEHQTHIKGGKVKRRSYLLTPKGMLEVPKIEEIAEKNGIDIDSLLDLKRQDANIILNELSKDDMRALGCACAFRIPIPMSMLPPHNKSVIPMDVTEYTAIDKELRSKVLDAANPLDRDAWHGFACDYWVDHIVKDDLDRTTCIHEILYHMVSSGRNRDACKLVSEYEHDFLATANDDVYDSLNLITKYPKTPARFAVNTLSVTVKIDLLSDDFDNAEIAVKKLAEYDESLSEIYHSDIEYKKGNIANAMAILTHLSSANPMAEIRIAEILMDQGKFDDAKKVAENITGIFDTSNATVATERFIILAKIKKHEGKDSDAYAILMKAKSGIPDKGKKRIDDLVKELDIRL